MFSSYTPTKNPNAGLDSNFCRNPDGDSNGPWCYTTDPNQRFEFCNIPQCEGQKESVFINSLMKG